MQQKALILPVKDLIDQINALELLEKLGTTIRYVCLDLGRGKLSVLVFVEASLKTDNGKLSFLSRLIFGDLICGSVFHLISWISCESRRPAKSIASAEIRAAGEVIDEGKFIVKACNDLIGLNLDLWIASDSRDLFSSLST